MEKNNLVEIGVVKVEQIKKDGSIVGTFKKLTKLGKKAIKLWQAGELHATVNMTMSTENTPLVPRRTKVVRSMDLERKSESQKSASACKEVCQFLPAKKSR